MASTGVAGYTVFHRSVIVRVDYDPLARGLLWCALAVLPAAVLLKWVASEDAAMAHSSWVVAVSYGISAVLAVLTVAVLVRGTTRAQLFVDNELVDTLRWSTAPKRKLRTTLDDHPIEAEIDTSGDREVKLFVDGNLLRAVKVV
jgi:hypothetical protein